MARTVHTTYAGPARPRAHRCPSTGQLRSAKDPCLALASGTNDAKPYGDTCDGHDPSQHWAIGPAEARGGFRRMHRA